MHTQFLHISMFYRFPGSHGVAVSRGWRHRDERVEAVLMGLVDVLRGNFLRIAFWVDSGCFGLLLELFLVHFSDFRIFFQNPFFGAQSTTRTLILVYGNLVFFFGKNRFLAKVAEWDISGVPISMKYP